MALNGITFSKGNGGMGRVADSKDVVSGLILCFPGLGGLAELTETFEVLEVNSTQVYVQKLDYFEQLSDFGIERTALADVEISSYGKTALENIYARNAISYHVSEFFRMSPTGSLYLMLTTETSITGDYLTSLQTYANGEIRQVGVAQVLTDGSLQGLQETATALESALMPISSIVCTTSLFNTVLQTTGNTAPYNHTFSSGENSIDIAGLTNIVPIQAGLSNVSFLIGADLDAELIEDLGNYAYYGCIGTTIGAISRAKVHESIAWVAKFPLSLKEPGFITGDLLKDVEGYRLNLLNDGKLIFVRRHIGDANSYFNDSYTLDDFESDYCFIENVRTIDKACRGIYKNMLPHLNSPLYVDAESGKLAQPTVVFFELTAGKALEAMEGAGELSGYRVTIDPEQNILSTSKLELVIVKVGVGVMRKVNIKIGYTTKI